MVSSTSRQDGRASFLGRTSGLAAKGGVAPQTPVSQDAKAWAVAAKVRGLSVFARMAHLRCQPDRVTIRQVRAAAYGGESESGRSTVAAKPMPVTKPVSSSMAMQPPPRQSARPACPGTTSRGSAAPGRSPASLRQASRLDVRPTSGHGTASFRRRADHSHRGRVPSCRGRHILDWDGQREKQPGNRQGGTAANAQAWEQRGRFCLQEWPVMPRSR